MSIEKNNTENIIAKGSMNNVPVSPRRMQLVANFIRGKEVMSSVAFLSFDKRKASQYVLNVLKSAVASAKELKKVEADSLIIQDVKLGKGLVLKNRGVPGARGQFKPMKKRTSNFEIILASKKESK